MAATIKNNENATINRIPAKIFEITPDLHIFGAPSVGLSGICRGDKPPMTQSTHRNSMGTLMFNSGRAKEWLQLKGDQSESSFPRSLINRKSFVLPRDLRLLVKRIVGNKLKVHGLSFLVPTTSGRVHLLLKLNLLTSIRSNSNSKKKCYRDFSFMPVLLPAVCMLYLTQTKIATFLLGCATSIVN